MKRLALLAFITSLNACTTNIVEKTRIVLPENWLNKNIEKSENKISALDSDELKNETFKADLTNDKPNETYNHIWWKSFNDKGLEEVINLALADNLDLQASISRVKEQEDRLKIEWATLLPSINLIGTQERSKNYSNTVNPGSPSTFNRLGFDASWELDVFQRQMSRVHTQKKNVSGILESDKYLKIMVVSETAKLYTSLKATEQKIKVFKDNVNLFSEYIELLKKQEKNGLISLVELNNAESQYYQLLSRLNDLEKIRSQLAYSLDYTLGKNPGFTDEILENYSEVPFSSYNYILDQPANIILKRPDVLEAEHRLVGANYSKQFAYLNLLPSISLTAFLGYQNYSNNDLIDGVNKSWEFSGNFAQPIFSFGKVFNGVKIAKSQEQSAMINYKKVMLNAVKEVETSLNDYLNEMEKYEKFENSYNKLANAVEAENKKFEQGFISKPELIIIKLNLNSLKMDLIEAKASNTTSLINLYKSLAAEI